MSPDIPAEVRRLFWDVRPETVDVERHRKWLIRRVLDWGDVPALKWLRQVYGDDALKQVVAENRGLARKTHVFWVTYFGLPET